MILNFNSYLKIVSKFYFFPRDSRQKIVRTIMILLATLMWAFRLTFNWFRDFRNLTHEDWRYVELGAMMPNRFMYWLGSSLMGFHLIPTLMTFSAMLPAYKAIALSYSAGDAGGLFGMFGAALTGTTTYGLKKKNHKPSKSHNLNFIMFSEISS